MKAPDIVPSWKWKSAEEIIERLLAESARTIGLPAKAQISQPSDRPPRDRHYFAWRRCLAMRQAKQELARLMGRG